MRDLLVQNYRLIHIYLNYNQNYQIQALLLLFTKDYGPIALSSLLLG